MQIIPISILNSFIFPKYAHSVSEGFILSQIRDFQGVKILWNVMTS